MPGWRTGDGDRDATLTGDVNQPLLISGALANKCGSGGAAWTRLNWALGFSQLGFDVCFVEQIDSGACIDAQGRAARFEESENLRYFEEVLQKAGLGGRCALVCDGGNQIAGLSLSELTDIARDAVFLVNITGNLRLENVKGRVRRKVYVDLDPGFTQFWRVKGRLDETFDDHDYYFTIGENIGRPCCPIPTGGIHWRPTRQPVVLDRWPCARSGDPARFTTVGAWRGPYGPVEEGEQRYGLKVHEFRKVLELPQKVEATFELALDIDDSDRHDRAALESHGWTLVDPRREVPDPWSFRRYVQQSGAEFSVAKEIYVATNSGWFSDRSVRYLASGKPVLVQDTGLARHYPLGQGIVAFQTLDDAIRGAYNILNDYQTHSEAARRIAEDYFDSDRVLGRLTEQVVADT